MRNENKEQFNSKAPICPHCNNEIDIAQNEWWHIYDDEDVFEEDCPNCGETMFIQPIANWSFNTCTEHIY